MSKENIVLIPMEETTEEIRIKEAIKKLKKFDNNVVENLEALANLAEKNKVLFSLGLNYLKRR
jgi:hypothetical protein